MSGTWLNNDKLYIKYGTAEGVSAHPAGAYSYPADGSMTVAEVVIDLTLLTQTETILNDVVVIPANSQIMWVEVQTLVGATAGTAIDVGLIDQDRTTEINYDGFLAAFEDGDMDSVGDTVRFHEGHTVPASVTGTGALVGQEVTNAGYISASRTDGTAFTNGKIRFKVAYIPKGIDVPA